ncbi:MAG: heat-inducible transcription repressor HrcA [Candidatus Bipolaricaulota bacterium]|nr:MAG: heat-inducible transcription repressor HrcA [Candidatus Bipolaricaulota bacterium]
MELPERQRLILKEIVDRFIRQREPVSSRMILEDYGLPVSSATVRNDMNDLEAHGFIEKPYASSGRIPTRLGYRFFVDWLLDLSRLSQQEPLEIVEAYDTPCLDVGETMRRTALLLGSLTDYAAFVVPPAFEEARLVQVTMAQLDARTVLLIIVSDIGVIEHGVVSFEDEVASEEIPKIVGLINKTLAGTPLASLRSMSLFDEGFEGWYEPAVRQAMLILQKVLSQDSRQPLFLEGLTNVVGHLEAVQGDRAMKRFLGLVHAVQDRRRFADAVRATRSGKEGIGVSVSDFPLPNMEDFSVITMSYRPHGGVLGVVAPLWMDYSKALSTVSYVAHRLEAFLTRSCVQPAEEILDVE